MNDLTGSARDDTGRGRGRHRDADLVEEYGATHAEDGSASLSTAVNTVPLASRKRRRSRKGLEKKFDCKHDGCGKSYSRAEHLYRHELNRTLIISFYMNSI